MSIRTPDLSNKQWVMLIVLCGVLLRLAMMPFFMYVDLFSEYRRINYISENLSAYPGFNRNIAIYIELAFFALTKWLLVNPEQHLLLLSPAKSEASFTDFLIFVKEPSIFRYAFLMKLPYFVFDLFSALLVWKFFKGHRFQRFALLLWLFNPVTLYATYYFGRYEAIGLFFLIATAYLIKEGRMIAAVIMFGLAVNCREIFVLFAPALFLAMTEWDRPLLTNIKRISPYFLIVVLFISFPFILSHVFELSSSFTKESNPFEVKRGLASFFNREFNGIYPFILLGSLCYFSLITKRNLSRDAVFVIGCLSIILPYFVVGFHSAHYFTWAVPFLVLIVYHADELKFPTVILFLCWLLYWLFYDQRYQLTPISLAPIDESFAGRRNFAELVRTVLPLNHVLNDTVLKNIFRTVCISAILLILYRANNVGGKSK